MMTNKLPWSRGYFRTIENMPLAEGEVLPRHCFRAKFRKDFAEAAIELPGDIEPCGDWVLHSFRTIDDEVSDALGIPRVPKPDGEEMTGPTPGSPTATALVPGCC